MFTPKYSSSRTGFSPFGTPGKTPGLGNQSRRKSGLFTPQRGGRPQKRPSLLQSSFVGEDVTHRLDNFGLPLPIQITEALTLSDRSSESSACVGASGWAWLVCERKLFVWKYKSLQQSRTTQCRELALPPSSSPHHADLVVALPSSDGTRVGCVAASPGGIVRYWPNISHEGSYGETSLEVKDAKCKKVIALQSGHCILGASNSTLYLLTPIPGQKLLQGRPLIGNQGMLSGISRRMSSFIFGAGPAPAEALPLCQLVSGSTEDGVDTFFTLSGNFLQKWSLSEETERMLYQINIDQWVKESSAEALWKQEASQLPNLKTWLLDIYHTKDSVVVLGACVNPDVSSQVSFVLGHIHTEGSDAPQCFLQFTVTKFTSIYQDRDESAVIGYRLMIPDLRSQSAYLHDHKCVVCVSVRNASQTVDRVEFQASGDRLLGAGACENTALFFSMTHGMVSIKPTQGDMSMQGSILEEPSRGSIADGSMMLDSSKLEEMSMSEDNSSRLKAAFLYSCQGNIEQAQSVVDEVFPSYAGPTEGVTSLDKAVIQLSQDLIDDYPASDPRWAESVPQDIGASSASLIIQHQLEDKLKAHGYLMTFLSNCSLLERLSKIPVRGAMMSTRCHLSEHAEKLLAAMALRALHVNHSALMDECIQRLLKEREEAAKPGLAPQDIFYREVSRVDELFLALTQYQHEAIRGGSPAEGSQIIYAVNDIVQNTLSEACQYRETKASVYTGDLRDEVEFIPWTASLGPDGCRQLLKSQHVLTLEVAVPQAQDAHSRGGLYAQLVEITDLILDGYNTQLDSLRRLPGGTDHYTEVLAQYEHDRKHLLLPFVEHEQFERAAALAEKYCDFFILIRICEVTNNQDRLQRYMVQFQNKGFSDHVFKYYTEEGKRGKLMSTNLSKNPRLGNYLQSGENKFMSWLYDINSNDFYQAHKSLKELAEEETKSVAKKKTLLALSKLAALASDDPPDDIHSNIEEINDQQDLILHQETLPADVTEALGLDLENTKPISPKELIELYISDYNRDATEYDFKKALDLLQFAERYDPEVDIQALRLEIWCKIVLRDSWDNIEGDDPLLSAKETIFFKTVQIAYTENVDLCEFLPDVNSLLASEHLGRLKEDKNFQYLIRAGYEQISRLSG